MPSKEAKKRKIGKAHHAANKEKLHTYSRLYSKEHNRKEYYHDYYAYDTATDLSLKRSAATSKLMYYKDPEKAEPIVLHNPNKSITGI